MTWRPTPPVTARHGPPVRQASVDFNIGAFATAAMAKQQVCLINFRTFNDDVTYPSSSVRMCVVSEWVFGLFTYKDEPLLIS